MAAQPPVTPGQKVSLSREIDTAYNAYRLSEPRSMENLRTALLKKADEIIRRQGVEDAHLGEQIAHHAMMKLDTFRGRSKLSTWFQAVVQNKARSALRQAITARKKTASMAQSSSVAAQGTDSAAKVDLEIAERCLSAEQLRIMRLCIQGYTLGQISNITGWPLGTVRSRYERAKRAIRKAMSGRLTTRQS